MSVRQNNIQEPSNKQELKEELKNVKTIYVVFINKQHTKMNLHYIKDGELEEVWITPFNLKDKPSSWGKTGMSQERTYCFKGDGIRDVIWSLYNWLDLSKERKDLPIFKVLN